MAPDTSPKTQKTIDDTHPRGSLAWAKANNRTARLSRKHATYAPAMRNPFCARPTRRKQR